jgi:hypothetical protein
VLEEAAYVDPGFFYVSRFFGLKHHEKPADTPV